MLNWLTRTCAFQAIPRVDSRVFCVLVFPAKKTQCHRTCKVLRIFTVLIEMLLKMIFIVSTLSLFVFVTLIVSGQICVEETLDCRDPVSTVFKLGNASCACNNSAHAGALKYFKGEVYVCLGSEWKIIHLQETTDYAHGTPENPGSSCKDIHDKAGQQLSDGVFWIRLLGNF